MIKTFADAHTRTLFQIGLSTRLPPDLVRRAVRKLEYLHSATSLEGLKVPPGNRLHALKGDRHGQFAIWVNDQWRLCFRFLDGDSYEVEIVDYH
jgi:proteic killer suppression protein